MQFFEHNIENVCIKQRRYSEDKASCQAEDMVATEVADEVDAVKVVGRIMDRDQEIMEVEMTMETTTRIEMKKKGRRHLNLTLQENNMLTHMIQ